MLASLKDYHFQKLAMEVSIIIRKHQNLLQCFLKGIVNRFCRVLFSIKIQKSSFSFGYIVNFLKLFFNRKRKLFHTNNPCKRSSVACFCQTDLRDVCLRRNQPSSKRDSSLVYYIFIFLCNTSAVWRFKSWILTLSSS